MTEIGGYFIFHQRICLNRMDITIGIWSFENV